MPWCRFSAPAKIATRQFAIALLLAGALFGGPADEVPGEIRDIAGPIEMPPDPVWPIYAGIAAGIAALSAALVYFVKRRRAAARAAAEAEARRPRPADEVALEALSALESAPPHDQKLFYTQLTDVLRAYVARRFAVDEPDATSGELLKAIARTREVGKEHQALLRRVFTESDMVKFASAQQAPDAPALAIREARRFVLETTTEVTHAAL